MMTLLFALLPALRSLGGEGPAQDPGSTLDLGPRKAVVRKVEALPFVESEYTKRFVFDRFDNPKLKKAPERLEGLRTPEGEAIPPNTMAELRRDMARRQFVRSSRNSWR